MALETARQNSAYHAVEGGLEGMVRSLFARAALQARYAGPLDQARAEVDAQGKALHSLLAHEVGLSVFVQRPGVPLDNKPSEQALRRAVIARYTSFRSGSAGQALLSEQMYSIYATLHLAGLRQFRTRER